MNHAATEGECPVNRPPNGALGGPLDVAGVSLLAVDTDAVPSQPEWLSPAERTRADQYITEQLRNRFIARRSALRQFVGAQLRIDPLGLVPNYSCPDHGQGPGIDHGKPGFSLAGQPLDVVLSSSSRENLAVFAISQRTVRLGLDVERIGAVSFEGFDASVLNGQELDTLLALPEAEQDAFRARCWACKEALAKAWGTGLRIRPTEIDSNSAGLVDVSAQLLGLPTGYALALAVLEPGDTSRPKIDVGDEA